MVIVKLFNAPNQRRVRFLTHDDFAERIGGHQHCVCAGVDRARIDAGASHEGTVKALDQRTLHRRRLRVGWLGPE
jgi:hypothetical protein